MVGKRKETIKPAAEDSIEIYRSSSRKMSVDQGAIHE